MATERFDKDYEVDFEKLAEGEIRFTGIRDAAFLEIASLDALVDAHLAHQKETGISWYRNGAVLTKIMVAGDYCKTARPDGSNLPYGHNRAGFLDFIHDRGSHISPDEAARQIKVFTHFNLYPVSVIRQVEEIGPNKAFAMVKYVRNGNASEVLALAKNIPYSRLRHELALHFPVEKASRNRPTKAEQRRAQQKQARLVIADSDNGMIDGLFVGRVRMQESWDETWAQAAIELAMNEQGYHDIDEFMIQYAIPLIAKHALTPAQCQRLDEQKAEWRRGTQRREAEANRIADAA